MSFSEYYLHLQGEDTVKKPATGLVEKAMNRWNYFNYRADNTSVIVVILDPPGTPRPPMSGQNSETSSTASTMDLSNEEEEDVESEFEDEEPLRLELENQHISISSPSVSASPLTECKVTDNQLNCKKLWKPAARKPIYKGTRPFAPGSAPPKLGSMRRLCKVRPKFQKMARLHGSGISPGLSSPYVGKKDTESGCASPLLKTPTPSHSTDESEAATEKPEVSIAAKRLAACKMSEGISMTPGRMGVDIGCPQTATTPCSPLKVNVAQNSVDINSPCIGMVSPIWPNSLDLSLDIEVAAEVSLETCVPPNSCPHKDTNVEPSDEENVNKQPCTSCRTPTKMGLKRKADFSPTQSPIKHLRLSSPQKTRNQLMNLRARSKTRKE